MEEKEIYKQLIEAKLTLFAMIDQFMYETKNSKGEECFNDYCESARKKAFDVLGFKDDIITKKDFYREYDNLFNELLLLNGVKLEKQFFYLDFYLKEKEDK